MSDEEVLAGGNMNAVVRVGDRVRRRSGPWTPTVHRFLLHLRSRGVGEVPEPLGMLEDGREALSFIRGEVPLYPMPAWVWSDRVLLDATALLRRIHDASTDFDTRGARWQLPPRRPAEVVCHNDFSPHNLLFEHHRVTGVIDFDTCAPGPRVWDLAYLATRIVPLTAGGGDGSADWSELMRRTALLLEGYGSGPAVEDLLVVAVERLLDLAAFSERAADRLGKPELREHADHYRADAKWLRRAAGLA